MKSKEWLLVSRPVGEPVAADFELREVDVREPGPGEVVVRNEWMSVDPGMRGRMRGVRTYIAPFELGEPMEAGATGTVVASNADSVPVGATVQHVLGWREYAVLPADQVRIVPETLDDPSDILSAVGLTGYTAYLALAEIAPVKPGSVVFVSGAAGAVGTTAAGIARQLGAATVIGSAGGPEKCRILVEELGYDHAIDYRAGTLKQDLAAAAPDGIDIYLDNVGGEHLQVAIGAMRPHGRIALCGAVSQYNAVEPQPGPNNLAAAVGKRLGLQGFIVYDHLAGYDDYFTKASGWVRDGLLANRKTVVDGIENATGAFIGQLRGDNVGKMLVRISAPA
ncbi:NADP-dependent oxidoreductase [Amycolatopsis jejuensis]|uniref:NADP-dependent oxidoreductase n=1 Tax=Amycolatopsis jejuensis TaxID=330084 RepID=UPI000527BD4F|nr:NADP-dependent oxidoreductase [Amycolatopsis jejuensis]